MSVSLVLFIAKVCLGLLVAQVWKHKLARSESCEYLLLHVRSYTPSGVTPRPELRPSTLCLSCPDCIYFVYCGVLSFEFLLFLYSGCAAEASARTSSGNTTLTNTSHPIIWHIQ